MLDSHRKGFAVMNKDLTAYSFEDERLEHCKRYCRNNDVIVEKIPYKIGYSIRLVWHKFWKPFDFKYYQKNILWLHWSIRKEFSHKNGKIVYRSGS
jgi:hypothetical protein